MSSAISRPVPTILLVHGAWHGSWCWEKQIPELEALGYATVAVDLPCTSGKVGTNQFDDAALVRYEAEQLLQGGKDVLVVAHSYAGPIASAGLVELSTDGKETRGHFRGLILLCGYIFPGGMDQGAVIKSMGGLPYVDWDTPSPGLFTLKDPAPMLLEPDVTDQEERHWHLSRLRPQSMAANMGVVPPQVWQDMRPMVSGRLAYIRCSEDRVIPLADQDAMISGAGGQDMWVIRTLEGSGHSPFISRPKELAQVMHELVMVFRG